MKIILDNIIYALQNAGGISTYWRELSSRLIRNNCDLKFREFSKSNDNVVRRTLSISEGILLKNKRVTLFDRFKPLALKSERNKFIFHSSYNTTTKSKHALQVCTIHDFVHEKFYSGIRRLLHVYQKTKAIKQADHIIVISNNTKNDLLQLHPYVNPEQVSVIYNGASDEFFPTIKQKNIKPYLLFIGSREHYKNFNFCVKLLNQATMFDLKIIGSPLKKSEIDFLNQIIPERWSVESNIDNAKLNSFYNNAFALLYPSSYEGFGIPILEAMKAGTPFIALNNSSIPEVAGNAGILLDSLNIEDFMNALHKISLNRLNLIEKGFIQSQKFSWDKCFQQTLKVYNDLYNS
ncbi:hypothetical protein ASE92_15785 [Pedobacter sp. Leaf41]|uniref:glycosyltransferase family 4 protein n=1 Tax=Pedobacter sp. Leaf41 TaxID=1736218 RepID=UPI0007029BDF|nr:glycosyltransferase family 1 protein [Pedobacter sp. Leaf41]KQN34084.1 hypothetical protein ASE92_15785 [Pedobacter sp. Leaf41]